jgi:excisionase family DNA binding protein
MNNESAGMTARESGQRRGAIINGIDTTVGQLPILMDVAETAAALRVSTATIRKAIKNSEIPSVEIAGRTRVISAHLLAIFDEAERQRLAMLGVARS